MSKLLAKDTFKKIHKTGLNGIISNYEFRKDKKVLIVSLLVSISLTVFAVLWADLNGIIIVILDMLFSTVPTIIGFLVAGFALMFGFGDKLFLKKASRIKRNTSYYLSNVRAFSFALVVLIFTQFVLFVFKVLISIPSPFNELWLFIGHIIMSITLLFLGFYSMFLLYHAVKNVFNLTINHHAFLVLSNDDKEESIE